MTVEQYANKYNKNIKTVLKWVYDGLIPSASIDNNYIPDSAREPYFPRAKNVGTIYESIVKASCNLKHVCPQSYGLNDDEFLGYIERLINAKLIVCRVTDGVTYYDATIEANNINKKYILDCIERISCGIAQGVMSAIQNS